MVIHWFQRFSNNLMLFCRMICLWSQYTPQFLLHWNQIFFSGEFFWGLQTTSSHWEPDLENRVGAEAIQSAIYVVLPSLRSTCDTVDSLGERALFSSFVAIFWQFLPSNTQILLYNICYWWFFLSQGNRTKYFTHPKIQRQKPWLLMFVSLFTLDSFHLLLSTQLITNLTPEWSGGSRFHPLSHIYTKIPFCCVETIANNTLNHQHIVVFDRLSKYGTHFEHSFFIEKRSCKMVNTLPSDIFNYSTISCNFNLWSAKTSLWSFLVFSRTNAKFGQTCIQHHLCLYNND